MGGKTVVILGGGVAGLSAAHELAERGFSVTVYEKRDTPGGKARSVLVKDTGKNGRRDLPGEHGFRFFPRFYKHLPDTMSRIPYGSNKNGAAGNLVETTRLEYPRMGKVPIVVGDRFPRTLADWKLALHTAFAGDYGFKPGEQDYFAERVWQILTSCEDRRDDQYERLDWWDFVGAESRSLAYQKYLAGGLTRSLNAAKAKDASTRTIGNILVQLLLDVLTPGISSDRLLNGPTNDVWMNPWLDYLRQRGVDYRLGVHFDRLHCSGGRITSVTLTDAQRSFDVQADYYVCAVPLEVMAKKIEITRRELLAADPTLQGIIDIRANVQWMNGIQFYLRQDHPLVHGHSLYVDSAWALTSVSQAQFWRNIDWSSWGDGTVRGVLSVDISEWGEPGSQQYTGGLKAKQCTHQQIADEVWFQLKQSLNYPGHTELSNDILHSSHLDHDIIPEVDPLAPDKERDSEPLLVNNKNTWDKRPDAYTRIPNLFLAADYVRTNTDLATMEGANEAARRAVNSILEASGSNAPLCKIWKMHEPDLLGPWRAHDQARYDAGLPWNGTLDLERRFARFFN